MVKFLKVIFVFVLVFNGVTALADDILPQNYTLNNINPYKTKESWFKLVKANDFPAGKIQPEFYHPEKMQNPFKSNEESKYNNVLSRMEREWFRKEYTNLSDEDRVCQLEEKVFGAIHDGDIKFRCNQLRKAFDAKKSIQAKHRNYTRGMYSGLPTSTPMNIDGLLGN